MHKTVEGLDKILVKIREEKRENRDLKRKKKEFFTVKMEELKHLGRSRVFDSVKMQQIKRGLNSEKWSNLITRMMGDWEIVN